MDSIHFIFSNPRAGTKWLGYVETREKLNKLSGPIKSVLLVYAGGPDPKWDLPY